jgi:hypothetical protein
LLAHLKHQPSGRLLGLDAGRDLRRDMERALLGKFLFL